MSEDEAEPEDNVMLDDSLLVSSGNLEIQLSEFGGGTQEAAPSQKDAEPMPSTSGSASSTIMLDPNCPADVEITLQYLTGL